MVNLLLILNMVVVAHSVVTLNQQAQQPIRVLVEHVTTLNI